MLWYLGRKWLAVTMVSMRCVVAPCGLRSSAMSNQLPLFPHFSPKNFDRWPGRAMDSAVIRAPSLLDELAELQGKRRSGSGNLKILTDRLRCFTAGIHELIFESVKFRENISACRLD